MNNIRSTLVTVWRIAAPYFRSEDKWAGRSLLAAVIAIELAVVFLTVLFNRWNNIFYNALQERNQAVFTYQIAYFCVLATFFIALKVYQLYLNQWLQIRWRRWMTARYLGGWLHDANHYRMQLLGDAADNPDQRIAEDTQRFVEQTLALGIGLLSAVVTLGSFVVILWNLSNEAPLHLFGKDIPIPGYLVLGALIYALLGTLLTYLIGRPLVELNFQQQRFEGDFRFNLVRTRENAEQIALLRGEPAERSRLLLRFGAVVDNWLGIMQRTKKLTAFTATYSQVSIIVPYVLIAPAYFADKIQLGGMMQTANAFSSVQDALSFFISSYRTLAEWQSVVARLSGFETAIANATTLATSADTIDIEPSPGSAAIDLRHLDVRLPNGSPLVSTDSFSFRGQRAHPDHRTVRLRQIDLVSRHRRHLAVWNGHDRDPCEGVADDAAAAAVSSGRVATGGDCLSRGSKRLWFGPGQGGSDFGGSAEARVATRGRRTLESNAFPRGAAAPRARPRVTARAAIPVPR